MRDFDLVIWGRAAPDEESLSLSNIVAAAAAASPLICNVSADLKEIKH